ncbi:hypothetical protein KAR91_20300, partial [Candidatus Pacearchaeota archaeon]|nr:hypothetical protein [Candidatus Pacearchaeota archaeon]
ITTNSINYAKWRDLKETRWFLQQIDSHVKTLEGEWSSGKIQNDDLLTVRAVTLKWLSESVESFDALTNLGDIIR